MQTAFFNMHDGFCRISSSDAIAFLLPRHYAGRKPNVSFAYGYYENNILKAVCTFGKPASPFLCVGICGAENSAKVYELNRLCVDGTIAVMLSQFVAYCLRDLSNRDLIIVSYADQCMHHVGYIYQATNFIYTGTTKERTDIYTHGNKHSRHYDGSRHENKRKYRSAKHRYVFFATDKKKKSIYRLCLKYPVLPYPKGETKKYQLGEIMETKIIDFGKQPDH